MINENCDDYHKYVIPQDKMITIMLKLTTDKIVHFLEENAQSVREQPAEFQIDKRSVYDNLDQIFKDTDMYM